MSAPRRILDYDHPPARAKGETLAIWVLGLTFGGVISVIGAMAGAAAFGPRAAIASALVVPFLFAAVYRRHRSFALSLALSPFAAALLLFLVAATGAMLRR